MPLSENYEGWAKLSPFYYYQSSNPLVNGMNWTHGAILFVTFIGLIALSIPLFQRRDLRG
jgi:ABC-2 type transport system permease protein